ncbi:MAG: LPS-assembly protein LptD [Alphaproteobacteria bacterium]
MIKQKRNTANIFKNTLKGSISLFALSCFMVSFSTKAEAKIDDEINKRQNEFNQSIDFMADELVHDRVNSLISAKGHVEINSGKSVLKADNITFYQRDNLVKASGNIILLEETGNVIFADYLELKGDLKDGFIDNIKIIMSDHSRLAAKKIARSDKKNVLEYGVFTPCDICAENPEKPPVWQIKAIRVIYDEDNQKVSYRNAWLELGSVPVFYTPYFSHPSPEVKRRSGFLAPKIGNRKNIGESFQIPYFYDISPQEDLTFTPMFTTKENIVLKANHRKMYDEAESDISGSLTQDSNNDIKGNIDLYARKELNDYYVVEANVARASDDTYLKRYGFKGEDKLWLESSLNLEGFDGRSYVNSKAFTFQDMRSNIINNNTPVVLEPLNFNLINDPEKYGSYTSLTGSSMILDRQKGVKSRRVSLIAGWHLPYTSPYGDIYQLSASLRGDGYHVENVAISDTEEYSGFVSRVFPELAMEWRYPFVKREEASHQVLEPIVVGVISPNNVNNIKIPNEDSRDIELDDTNILESNHFIGYDRVESGARVNYGLRWSAYGETTGQASGFLGQSYRFTKDNYFPEESGINKHFSDYVGKFKASPNDFFDMSYSFRLDQNTFDARRHEFAMSAGTPAFKVSPDYTYINSSEFSDLKDRKEIGLKLNSELSRYWNAEAYHRYDLTKDGGTLEYGVSLIYDDECFTVDTSVERDYTSDQDYEGGFSIGITFYFKPFGKVQTGQ